LITTWAHLFLQTKLQVVLEALERGQLVVADGRGRDVVELLHERAHPLLLDLKVDLERLQRLLERVLVAQGQVPFPLDPLLFPPLRLDLVLCSLQLGIKPKKKKTRSKENFWNLMSISNEKFCPTEMQELFLIDSCDFHVLNFNRQSSKLGLEIEKTGIHHAASI
jgi:hypothetical protein